MNKAEQTPGADNNFSTNFCTTILQEINSQAIEAITAFGHRVVKTEKVETNKIKVHTQCSSSLTESIPLAKRNSMEPCKGKGELIFEITKHSLDLTEGEFSHTLACKHEYLNELVHTAEPQLLVGTFKLDSIKSPEIDIKKYHQRFLNTLLSRQYYYVQQGYLNSDGRNIFPEQQQARCTVHQLSKAIYTLSHIFSNR